MPYYGAWWLTEDGVIRQDVIEWLENIPTKRPKRKKAEPKQEPQEEEDRSGEVPF